MTTTVDTTDIPYQRADVGRYALLGEFPESTWYT